MLADLIEVGRRQVFLILVKMNKHRRSFNSALFIIYIMDIYTKLFFQNNEMKKLEIFGCPTGSCPTPKSLHTCLLLRETIAGQRCQL